jgi:hypothetical protein
MSAQAPAAPRSAPDEAHVQEALARVSVTITRALLRIEENARRAAADRPPGEQEKGAGPSKPAPSDHPSIDDAPLTSGAARRA